jgi:hypothetical protein
MKKAIMSVAVAFAGLIASANAQTILFTQDFQTGPRTGPGANGTGNQSLAPYGYSVYNGANTAIESDGNGNYYGKAWSNYWWSGADSAINVQLGADAWGNGSLLSSYGLSAGSTVNYGVDTKIADQVGAGGTLGLTLRFFNADFSYMFPQSVFVSIVGESQADWTHHSLSAVIPVDAAIIQFGLFNQINNWSAGSAFIDNVQISASTASIPEPSVASLLGFGALGLVATRFRRRS